MTARRLIAPLLVILALGGGFLAGRAQADQPHMQAALGHLRAAKAELELATSDKGGHRAAAIRFTNDAIAQVEKGVTFDRRH